MEAIAALIIIGIYIIYCFYILFFGKDKLNKSQREHRERMKKFHDTENNNTNRHSYMYQDVEKEIIKVDHTFLKEVFLNNAKEIFLKYQNAMVKGDIKDIKEYTTDDFIKIIQNKIDNNKQHNINVIVENLYIYNAYLYEFSKSTESQIITIKLKAEMKTYEINNETQYITKGNKYAKVESEYKMQFERKTKDVKCQSCGAPVNIKDLSQCQYCGTPIEVKNNEWKLSYIGKMKD